MTPEQLVTAFVLAGFDTEAKVASMLEGAKHQMTRNALIIARDQLDQQQAAASAAIEAQRQALNAQIQAETDAITSGLSQ